LSINATSQRRKYLACFIDEIFETGLVKLIS